MTGLSAYKCSPRQIRKFAIRTIMAGRVPFIKSSPAMGKSAIVASIAKEFNLQLIDHRLSTSAPEDMSGLPNFSNGVASFAPFDIFPVEGAELPAGKQGWLLFLDEFNSATKMVQAAAYKLILDKMVGQHKLHPNVVIICAGNLATDRAIVSPVGTAMQSRLIHLTMHLDPSKIHEFMEDVAFPQKWDSRVIAYLSYKPSALYDFRPDHNEETFCAPRTWEFVNDLVRGQEYALTANTDGTTSYAMDEEAPLYAGAITSGEAVSFINFTKVYHSLPKVKEIVADPTGIPVPTDGATRYATITHLIEHVGEDTFDPIAEYIGRFTSEFRVLFFRALMIQKPELRKHQAFRRAMVELSRYLHDDDVQAAA